MKVTAWYMEGIDFSDAPSSMAELKLRALRTDVSRSDLSRTDKWEHLLQGKSSSLPAGWVYLEELATFRRGIATGANAFFLISQSEMRAAEIREEMTLECVGRASDVEHLVFRRSDFDLLTAQGRKTRLLNFRGPLNEPEAAYVRAGEASKVNERYLCAARSPWYSMEQRQTAPIWAAVFGRGDLKFVYNQAQAKSLTNFHCVYPADKDAILAQAMTCCLNSPLIRAYSKLHTRIYGGGLSKFEPNDLKKIPLPNLLRVSDRTKEALAGALQKADQSGRSGESNDLIEMNDLVERAGAEAAQSRPATLKFE